MISRRRLETDIVGVCSANPPQCSVVVTPAGPQTLGSLPPVGFLKRHCKEFTSPTPKEGEEPPELICGNCYWFEHIEQQKRSTIVKPTFQFKQGRGN